MHNRRHRLISPIRRNVVGRLCIRPTIVFLILSNQKARVRAITSRRISLSIEIFDFVTERVKRCIAAIVAKYGVYILCNKRCFWGGELVKGFWRGYLYNLFFI